MGFLSSIFDWKKKEEQGSNPTKVPRETPVSRDFTDSLQVNEALTRGLYFGDYPGLKLASALAMAPIKIPVFFQGFPIPKTEDEMIKDLCQEIVDDFTTQMQQVHIQRKREGTVWVWPKYSKRLFWEFIPDAHVTDIIRDIDTGEVIGIIVEEQLIVSVAYGKTATINRIRKFTKERIEVKYTGDRIPSNLKSEARRNILGILPVPFANECDGDDVRGHSLYGRIISDLKSYHDIDLTLSTLLSKFQTKLSIMTTDPDDFAEANGYTDAADMFTNFNIAEKDMIIGRKDKDDQPQLIAVPLQSYQAYMEALKLKFRKIVEGTGIPEIAWGLKTEGNLASVTENMTTLLMYVRGDQRECSGPWETIFRASIRLLMIARMGGDREIDITIKWNDLDAISDETKAKIFQSFADGLSKVMNVAGATKQQIYNLWKLNFPQATDEDFEQFVAGISAMAVHKAVTAADPVTAMDAVGMITE